MNLTMASYANLSAICQNTTGWSDIKAMTLKTIMDSHNTPFCFIQEHWQLANNLYKIRNQFDDYCVFSLPATKKNDLINKGRPSGGLSILYKKNLERYVTHVQVPTSDRVQAIRVSFPQCTYTFINVYFPTDPQRDNFDDRILLQTLEDIKYVLNSTSNLDNVILCGDFNLDFNRDTRFVRIVNAFMSEFDLESIWQKFEIDFTYCHPLPNGSYSFSKIDHFFVRNQLMNNCVEGTVLHLGENLSNHEIIYLKFNCIHSIPDNNRKPAFQSTTLRPNWQKATGPQVENLRDTLRSCLLNINVPDTVFDCRDLHCQDDNHKNLLDDYAIEVLSALEVSVDENIPQIFNKSQRTIIPGWTEFIKPLQDTANFWKFIWLSCGKPINTQVHFIYRRVRHNYHYAIRNLKRNTQDIKNSEFIKAATEGKVNDILKSIRVHRTGKTVNPNVVDNNNGEEQISEHFSSIYKGIYNRHSPLNFVDLAYKVNKGVSNNDIDYFEKITPNLIVNLIRKLNPGKNDEHFRFKSDALRYTSDILAGPISNILKAYLVHGHFTNRFLLCSLIPIVKNNLKSKAQSENYRLIAVSSLLLKLFDLLILHLFSSQLNVDSLQFGFQEHSSTDLCSWTLKESINYFINSGSPVYLCLMDLQKAFDTIKLDLLFQKLQLRLPGIFVRLILYTYLVQRCYVKWNNSTSSQFTISNGLRQGAVASPAFFNVYMDDLFAKLRKSGMGCQIENNYFGVMGYADDLSLISPSRKGLQEMINIVKDYCDNHGITISTNPVVSKTKTKIIVFNCQHVVANFVLYERNLPIVEKWEHLGHTILSDESDTHDITRARGKFISDIHSLHQEMGSINPHIFLKLVSIYLSSFYGSSLWDLNSKAAHSLYATYNYMIRDTFNLPFGCHRYILKEVSKLTPLQINLHNRFERFCKNLENSNRPEVHFLFRKQRFDCRSTFGRNYRNIIVCKKDVWLHYRVPEDCKWKIDMIHELMGIKHNTLEIKYNTPIVETLTTAQVEDILHMLCCN